VSTTNSLDTGTWARDGALAYWAFCHPATSLPEYLPKVLSALPPFAVLAEVEWATAAHGDEALVQVFEQAPSADEVLQGARDLKDVVRIDLSLYLVCRGPEGADVLVPDGGNVSVELRNGRVEVLFTLNVDLFARNTATVAKDNRELSRLNAPRLNAFLKRIPQVTGAQPCGFDANLYSREFDEHGVPDEPSPPPSSCA